MRGSTMSKRYEYEMVVYSNVKYRVFVVARDEDEAIEDIDLNDAEVISEDIWDLEIVDKEYIGTL